MAVERKENRAYSVRLSGADLRKLRALSARLGATESDIVRFALRHVLNRLAPLHDPDAHGISLLPVFMDFGDELTRYFDLDENSLDGIFNDSASNRRSVDREDISLLLLLGMGKTRLYARLSELTGEHIEPEAVLPALRKYLYDKYLYCRTA